MVPTDLPQLEDRNVRWCHCACRELHLSPVPCCSAWSSCSRGRMRWLEWKWQEHLCERGGKHFNKYLPYICSDDYEFKLPSSPLWDFYLLPAPLNRRREHSPRYGENTICSHAQKPSPRLNPSSAVPWLCKASSPDETVCCTATSFRSSCTLCSCCCASWCFPHLHLWILYCLMTTVISGVVIPTSNPLPLQNICQKIIGRS